MKKILTISFIFVSILSFGQAATVQELRSHSFKMKPFSIRESMKATNLKEIPMDTLLKATDNQITVAGLRALTGYTPFESYLITDSGKEGIFKVDKTDNSTADNLGIVLVDASGRRWKRVYDNAINVKWFGAKGNNESDESNYILQAISAMSSKTTLYFPSGQYKIGKIIVEKDINFSSKEAVFNLIGNGAGFWFYTNINGQKFDGGVFVGDSLNRDGLSNANLQIGLLYGDTGGFNYKNIDITGVTFRGTTVGIKIAYSPKVVENVNISNCSFFSSVGLAGGRGYGLQLSQAWNTKVNSCYFENNQRHGLYISEGKNYTVSNCVFKKHRYNISTGAIRVALSISRSSNVSVTACVFEDNKDGTIAVDSDSQGLAPYNILKNVIISSCLFSNNLHNDIVIGTTSPVLSECASQVQIVNNSFSRSPFSDTPTINIQSGQYITLNNNSFDISQLLTSDSYRVISIRNFDASQDLSNYLTFTNNSFVNYGPRYMIAFELADVNILSRSMYMFFSRNQFITSSLFQIFDFAGINEENVANPNLYLADKKYREITNNNSTPTITGLSTLIVSNSATTILSNLLGGSDGDIITIQSTNSNTTISNSNFYTKSNLSVTLNANNSITFIKRGAYWREIHRNIY